MTSQVQSVNEKNPTMVKEPMRFFYPNEMGTEMYDFLSLDLLLLYNNNSPWGHISRWEIHIHKVS